MAAVQMAPVAARAGIAAGTVYRYFPAKTDLVAALVAAFSARELAALEAVAARARAPQRKARDEWRPAPRRRSVWPLFGAFALGAAVAAVAGMFVERGDFLFAALASWVAGALTLAVGLSPSGKLRARSTR